MQDDIITPSQPQSPPTMGSDSPDPVPMPSTTPPPPMGSDDNLTAPLPPLGTTPDLGSAPQSTGSAELPVAETVTSETPTEPTIPTESFASIPTTPMTEPTGENTSGLPIETPVVTAPDAVTMPDMPTTSGDSTSFNAMPSVVPAPAAAVNKKKNKNLLILMALLVVLVLAAAAYFLVLNKSDDTASDTSTPATVAVEKVDPGTTDTAIDESMAALDDAKDFSSTDLSDTTLGL